MDIYDIELENKRHGYHFFDADTKRFFRSRILSDVFEGPNGILFVTSEQYRRSDGYLEQRRYTVRRFNPSTGECGTVESFQKYDTAGKAKRAAQKRANQTLDGRTA